MRDAVPGGHQAELARTDQHVAAEAVLMVDLAGPQPAHRLQAHVRMRRHLHAGLVEHVVRAVVVDEAPRPDQPPAEVGQQPPHDGALAQRNVLAREPLVHRPGGDAAGTAVRQTGRPVEIAHEGTVRGMFTVGGEALVDLVGQSPHFTAHAGGSAYNVAITLARLGAPVSLIARTGRDEFGAMLETKARESGVSFDRWQIVDEPTSLAVATLDAAGSAQYDFYFDGTAGLGWDDSVVDLAPTSGVLHLGSIATWRPPSAGMLQALQRRAYESGATLVCYDPNVRPALIADRDAARASIERCISAAHLVKASDEDVEFLYPGTELAEVAEAVVRPGPDPRRGHPGQCGCGRHRDRR